MLAYSTSAGAMLVGAQGVDAGIVYTDPADVAASTVTIDFNSDGTNELTIKGKQSGVESSDIRVAGDTSAFIHADYDRSDSNEWYGFAKSLNDQIGPGQGFANKIGAVLMYSGVGDWNNVSNKYLGVKFKISGAVHYGWVRLSVTGFPGVTTRITVHDYAYEITANTAILAGSTWSNTDPTLSISDSILSYTENAAATQIDTAATASDPEGDSDWDGGKLEVQITANNEATDCITIPDNVVGTINTDGFNLQNGTTVIGTLSVSEGTVTNGAKLTITFNSSATSALVQQTVRAIHYDRNTQ